MSELKWNIQWVSVGWWTLHGTICSHPPVSLSLMSMERVMKVFLVQHYQSTTTCASHQNCFFFGVKCYSDIHRGKILPQSSMNPVVILVKQTLHLPLASCKNRSQIFKLSCNSSTPTLLNYFKNVFTVISSTLLPSFIIPAFISSSLLLNLFKLWKLIILLTKYFSKMLAKLGLEL